MALDEAGAARLAGNLHAGSGTALPDEAGRLGAEWAVTVRDVSRTSSDHRTRSVIEADISGSGFLGGASESRTSYTLELEATIFDLKAKRRLGEVKAIYFAHGGSDVIAGLAVLGGLPIPTLLPIIRLPAGTSAMAICSAFGRTIGDALVQATTAPNTPSATTARSAASVRPVP